MYPLKGKRVGAGLCTHPEHTCLEALEVIRRQVIVLRLLGSGLVLTLVFECFQVSDDWCVLLDVVPGDAETFHVCLADIRLHEVGVPELVVGRLPDDNVKVRLLLSGLGVADEHRRVG